jgi:hypothetical protein
VLVAVVAGGLLAAAFALYTPTAFDRRFENAIRGQSAPFDQTSSNRMHERLSAIAAAMDRSTEVQAGVPAFGTNRPARIPILEADLALEANPERRMVLSYEIATQKMLAGDNAAALASFAAVEPMLAALRLPADQKRQEAVSLQGAIGLAALRLGEQENCLLHHSASSCLFPIEPAGVHALRNGSARATEAFQAQLALDPGKLSARWLLNIASMTLGEYPRGVPSRWLIPPDVFRSEYDIKRFVDVAAGTGVDVTGLAGGCILEDFDLDGDLDLMVSSWGLRDQLRLFRNDGNDGFVERTREAGLLGQWGGINLSHADYDNDGRPDVFVHRGGWLGEAGLIPNSLLRNNADGTFTDVTEAAGLLAEHPTHAAAWGDYDNDGWLDLFVGNEDSGLGTHPVQLYRNTQHGTFVDIAPSLGLGVLGMVKGAAWGDYDNDGWLDLYVSRFNQSNLLFHNSGRQGTDGPHFTEVAEAAGVADPALSFATWFFDYDNDGWLDIFVGGWSGAPVDVTAGEYLGVHTPEGTPRLFRNRGNGTFEDVTERVRLDRVHLAMGANFGDLDNDGFLDIYLGTGGPDLTSLVPNRMFRNGNGAVFQDVTTSGGFGHLQKGHGIAFGDLDNDGDQDVYAVMGGWFTGDVYQNVLFENPGHGHHWIALSFVGRRTNRSGVGVRVKIRVATPRGARDIFRVVSDGGSFGSTSFRQDIGLGDATAIEHIEVTWPVTGQTQTFRAIDMDQAFRINEDDARVTPLSRASFSLNRHGGRHKTGPGR